MMNRITQGMMNTQLLRNLNYNLGQMSHYQDQTATGRKINKPSDDPVGLSYAMRYRSDVTANEQYLENVDTATSWLDFTDTLMGQAGDALHRIRELSVEASNGSNPKTAMDAIKAEVMQLTDQLITIGNSSFNGKYVFNGQMTDKAPYSNKVTQVPFSSSIQGTVNVNTANVTTANNQLQLVIDRGQEVTVTLPPKDYSVGGASEFATDLQKAINDALPQGSSVLVSVGSGQELSIQTNNSGATGSVEITGGTLATQWLSAKQDLSDLVKTTNSASTDTMYHLEAQYSRTDNKEIYFDIATGIRMPVNVIGNAAFGNPSDDDNLFKVLNQITNALDQENSAGVSNLLGKLDTRMNSFLETRAELGAKSSRVQLSEERLKDININLKSLQSKTEDADMAELITTLKTYENVYQASLSVGAKVISPTLVDFLR
ncbi:hypothetical protein ASG89_29095 [Paenibacillus sp. Soil766]|uniref:flagellar hook-associated protein FlgL n=1 Tax=Paenibacillus sp. Soil766 TaxID=1736404 RepID=UPI00070F08F3|nr:flagellar hook-associated protein FlgL [Paenibacillus sp. Soil766]KRE97962.1 hypothetical protein ASG89_29095 [Paenibacillus sp. Soil766]